MSLIPTRGLVPGDFTYTATYDQVDGGTLTITADGACPNVAYDLQIEPQPFPGGLKFAFYGMIGPALPPPPYKTNCTGENRIPPNRDMRIPNFIFIVDAEHPDGVRVAVKFNWTPPPPSDSLAGSKQVVRASSGEPFTLAVPVNSEGVKFHYDQEKLDLVNAEIDIEGNIAWTLKPIAFGTSLVTAVSGFVGSERVWEVTTD